MSKEKNDDDVTRRTFLENAASVAALTGAFPIISSVFAKGHEVGTGAGAIAGGKVLSSNERNLPYGKETEMEVEWTATNGNKDTSRTYDLLLNVEGGYVHFIHRSSQRHGSMVMVVKATKGSVNGDKRTDTVEITIISPDGSTQKLPPREAQVNLNHLYEGMTPDEILQRMLKEKRM